jgi:hypothetical protein
MPNVSRRAFLATAFAAIPVGLRFKPATPSIGSISSYTEFTYYVRALSPAELKRAYLEATHV